jgi:hypothetical protein
MYVIDMLNSLPNSRNSATVAKLRKVRCQAQLLPSMLLLLLYAPLRPAAILSCKHGLQPLRCLASGYLNCCCLTGIMHCCFSFARLLPLLVPPVRAGTAHLLPEVVTHCP